MFARSLAVAVSVGTTRKSVSQSHARAHVPTTIYSPKMCSLPHARSLWQAVKCDDAFACARLPAATTERERRVPHYFAVMLLSGEGGKGADSRLVESNSSRLQLCKMSL